MFCCSFRTKTVTLKYRLARACTRVSLECGDETAKVLLQLQNRHLTRLVSYKSMSGLHVESGRRVKSKKTNAGIHFHNYRSQGPTTIPPKRGKTTMFCMQTIWSTETFGGADVNMFVDADRTQCQCVTWSALMVTDLTCFSHLRANQYQFSR